MKKIIGIFLVFNFLAFGAPIDITQEPVISTTPTIPNSQLQQIPPQNQKASLCPTQDNLKYFLISRNLATYQIVDVIPSKAVPGYCDVILKSQDNKMFFMRIRNDMAYIITGSVINASTNEVQQPDLKKYLNQNPLPQTQPSNTP